MPTPTPASIYRPWLRPLAAAILLVMLPAAPAGAESARHGWSDGDSYILMTAGERGSMMMHGSTSELRRARELRNGTEPLLFIQRGGKAYVVRDAATLEKAVAIFKPQSELGRRQGALGRQQGALGRQQGELGRQQAQLASRRVSERDASDELDRQQEELGRRQHELGEQQRVLGKQQSKLGQEQERLSREAQARFRALVDDAIRRGLTREVS